MSEFEQNVIQKLNEINQKLDKLLIQKPPTPAPAVATTVPVSQTSTSTQVSASQPTNVSPSAVVERQIEEEKLVEKPPVEGRRVCPDCGNTTFNQIEDKTQVLSMMGGIKIYAKKYVCKKCGKEM
ncbi:MAG: hypothetical protein JW891_10635 [Candidatus Lokiarchaeota archaeon]|nr:hypothetical protein [Candidatus Lokiarchaeota archaeon]